MFVDISYGRIKAVDGIIIVFFSIVVLFFFPRNISENTYYGIP